MYQLQQRLQKEGCGCLRWLKLCVLPFVGRSGTPFCCAALTHTHIVCAPVCCRMGISNAVSYLSAACSNAIPLETALVGPSLLAQVCWCVCMLVSFSVSCFTHDCVCVFFDQACFVCCVSWLKQSLRKHRSSIKVIRVHQVLEILHALLSHACTRQTYTRAHNLSLLPSIAAGGRSGGAIGSERSPLLGGRVFPATFCADVWWVL